MKKMKISDFNVDNIIDRLKNIGEITITVVGDYSLDKYVYSDPARDELSVETGLIAYQIHDTAKYAGIGGTVTNNLRSVGANVICIGLVGNDGEGFEMIRELKKTGADVEKMIVSDDIQTNTYLKPMRGQNRQNSVEINRLDFRNFKATSKNAEDKIIKNLRKAVSVSHGVIITDQFIDRNHGVITDKVRTEISRIALEYPNVFFCADSRGFINEFKNVIQKCNEFEIKKTVNNAENKETIKTRFVTLGGKGVKIYSENETVLVPSFKAKPPLDFCGAGDATNAGIMIGLTLGLKIEESVLLGACMASITIEQIGITGVAGYDQIINKINGKK